jgi:phosphoribosylaminoimidazolecarboxamide formyltransferase/IMP cyclohydrolase
VRGWQRPDLREAWNKAFATDKQAPFGGIIICNRPLTEALARAISEIFSEVIIAPEFRAGRSRLASEEEEPRLMRKLPQPLPQVGDEEDLLIRSVTGGVLVQSHDRASETDFETTCDASANRR